MARVLKKTEKAPTLVRVAKFPITVSMEQLATLQRVSDNLFEIWNHCRNERQQYFEEHLQALFERKKVEGDSSKLRLRFKEVYDAAPVNYMPGQPQRSQRAWLTTMRQERHSYAAVPCAWQQETLVILEGGYDSFLKLRKNGDMTARPPREKSATSFCEIQGLLGWQLVADGRKINPQTALTDADREAITMATTCEIVLSPGKTLYGGPELRWPIPRYQQLQLVTAVKLNKFTLYRERRAGKDHRYSISLAYAVPMPAVSEVLVEDKVFLVLGATSLGVSAPQHSFTIELWRSDKYWMRKIESCRERLKSCTKGSNSWERRTKAINRMYELLRRQTLQDHREVIVRKLKPHGIHFVIMAMSPIRAKSGALADGDNSARGGTLGANWSVQNTGSLAQLRQLLEQKVAEWGGSVEVIPLRVRWPHDEPKETRRQVAAERLREQILAS